MTDAKQPSGTTGRPVLHDTGRGLSVIYEGRHLYSRFDPAKNAILAAERTAILPETLVIAVSPLLGYGLDILLEKLPATSFLLALEQDENLMAFSVAHLPQGILAHPSLKYIRTASSARVLETVHGLDAGPFRRCLRIDLSGGSSLDASFYAETVASMEQYISRWWRNHLTLMKLGRNYARNMFRNCAVLPRSLPLPHASIRRPIFVAGAGPSLDASLSFVKDNRDSLFVMAVDTALPALRDANITPDAAVLVESQFWIERAFNGFAGSRIPVYADLTARPNAVTAAGGDVHFFFSEYTGAVFIDRFLSSGLAPHVIPPLGSVGLVALHLARDIASPGTPVIFAGLDFSYGKGFTHSRGATPARATLDTSTRFSPPGNGVPSIQAGVFSAPGKGSKPVYTDPSLAGYAELCRAYFGAGESGDTGRSGGTVYFYDLGETGLDTGCKLLTVSEAERLCVESRRTELLDADTAAASGPVNAALAPVPEKMVRAFLDNEKGMLEELKGILTGKIAAKETAEGNNACENTGERVAALVRQLDYLHIHFPDGYRADARDTGFLKRVRIELEYFLKTLNSAFSFPWS